MNTFSLIGIETLDGAALVALEEAILTAQNLLSAIAAEDFLTKATSAFGNNINAEKLENLRQQWRASNFESLPVIEIHSAAQIRGAIGAFSVTKNTIYLSQDFVIQNSRNHQAITNVLLEEIGHFIDAQINQSDSPGDEGAIFAAAVQGKELDESELQAIKAEDDIAAIALDGKVIQVEQNVTEIIPTIAVLNYAGDEGNYYDPSDSSSPLNSGRTPNTLIAPNLDPSEVKQEESTARSLLNTALTLGLFGPQTRELWQLYLDSSPTYHIDRAFFYDGSEIATGFSNPGLLISDPITGTPTPIPSDTQKFVIKILDILRDEIRDELKGTPKASYDIASLLPDYYLKPEYNYDQNDQRWEDRDGKPKAGLPQDYVSLAYSSPVTIPGLLAGGIGYGGNTALPETIDPKTGMQQPARHLIPDTRRLEGTVEVKKIKELFYRLEPKFKITVEDTIDFSPGNLGGGFAQNVTVPLWKLETNGGAYDVPFTVEFTPVTTLPFVSFGLEIDSRGFLERLKDFLFGIGSDVSENIYAANGLDNYEISNDSSRLTTQTASLTNIDVSNGLPFLGTLLATLPEAQFLEDLYAKIDNSFEVYFDGNEIISFQELQNTFYNILKEDTNGNEDGIQSLGILKDTNQDGNITQDDIVYTQDGSKFKLNFELSGTHTFDTALPSQFGLPGLGLGFKDAKAGVNLTYDLKFGFGIDTATDEFFFDTSPQDDLSITLAPILPTVEATLGFLQVDAKDIGSKLNFTVNLGDDNDNQLTIDELDQNNLTFSPTGAADIKLNFLSSIDGSAALPQIGTDLNLHWDFIQGGLAPTVSFDNTKLEFGSFLNDFLKPVVEPIQAITKPIQPVFEFLTTEIGILKELGISNPTLLGLAGGLSNNEEVGKAIAGIQLIGELSDLVNSIDVNNTAEFILNIGDINLNNFDLRDTGASIKNSQLTSLNTKSFAELANEIPNSTEYQAYKDFFTRISSNQTVGGTTIEAGSIQEFLSFPILENPESAIGLLTGQAVDFFNLDLPEWGLEFGIEGSFPIVGPIVVTFGGKIGAQLNLGFGYDSSGIQQWAENYNFDPNRTSVIFDGFFVDDNREGGKDLPELAVIGRIAAGVGVDVIIAAARIQGGIVASINVDLEDIGESGSNLGNSDGRLRGSELVNIIQNNPLCLIELGGQIDAFLGYYARIGWPPFGKKLWWQN